MTQILLILHLLFAVTLIGLVLLQKGKGASMGVAFGSGASQTVFGSKGSIGFLLKLTILIAACFFGTSIALTYIAAHQARQSHKGGILTEAEQISKITKQQKTQPKPLISTHKKQKTTVKKHK